MPRRDVGRGRRTRSPAAEHHARRGEQDERTAAAVRRRVASGGKSPSLLGAPGAVAVGSGLELLEYRHGHT
jgi:hypothetical protein